MNKKNEDVIRNYFIAIENSAPIGELEGLLHPNIVQHEYPSRFNPNGRTRNRAEILSDFEKGKLLLSKQAYHIRNILSNEDRVSTETEWIGTIAIPFGNLKPGDQLKANFGVFFRIADGRIIEQNNYDCIHPW